MPEPNPNAKSPNGDGKDGNQNDPWEKLRGQKDVNGVPKHPEEKADFYKAQSDASNRGANSIIEENKTLREENERLKTTPAPNPVNAPNTTDNLSSKIPNWNKLSPEQQTAILNSYGALHNDLNTVKDSVAKMLDEQNFNRDYNALILDENFKPLSNFKEEFRVEAYKKENLKTPLRTLAIAFLAEKGKWGEKPKEDEKEEETPSGLDTSGAGAGQPQGEPNTYTSKQAQELRMTDPKKYSRLVREKKLIIKD